MWGDRTDSKGRKIMTYQQIFVTLERLYLDIKDCEYVHGHVDLRQVIEALANKIGVEADERVVFRSSGNVPTSCSYVDSVWTHMNGCLPWSRKCGGEKACGYCNHYRTAHFADSLAYPLTAMRTHGCKLCDCKGFQP